MARTKQTIRRTKPAGPKPKKARKSAKPSKKDETEALRARANVGDYYPTTRKEELRYYILLASHEKGGEGEQLKWRMVGEGKGPEEALTSRTIPRPTVAEEEAYESRHQVTRTLGYNLVDPAASALAVFRLSHRKDGNDTHYYWKKVLTAEEKANHEKKKTSPAQKARAAALKAISAHLSNDSEYVPIQRQQRIASAIAADEGSWESVLAAIRKNPNTIDTYVIDKDVIARGSGPARNRRVKQSEEVILFTDRAPVVSIVERKRGRRPAAAKKASSPKAKKAAAPKKAAAKKAGGGKKAAAKKASSPKATVNINLTGAGLAAIAACEARVEKAVASQHKADVAAAKKASHSPSSSVVKAVEKAKSPTPKKAGSPKKAGLLGRIADAEAKLRAKRAGK